MVSKKNQKFQKVDLATFLASAPGDESAQAPSDEPKLRANKGHGGIGKIGSIQTTVSASGLKVAGYEVREHRQYAQGAKADKDDLAESMKRLRIVKPAREWKIKWSKDIPQIVKDHRLMVPSTGSTPFVDTVDALKYVLNQISALRKKSPGHDDPFIYMDFEGHNLGARDGTLSIVQLLLAPLKQIVFIDVLALRKATFETAGKDGTTLKDIIEDARFPIGFWAIGNDAANLWDEYKIMFRGVKDAQMAISYRVLNGLTKVIRRCVELTDEEAKAVNAVKDTGMMIFRGNNNRSAGPLRRPNFRSFVMRPLHADLVRYCFIDVVFLPMVWKYFTENRDVVDMEDLQLKIDTRVQWSTETYIQKLERRKDGDTELPNTDAMEKRMAERGYQHEEVTVDDMKKMLFTGRWDGRLRSAGDDGDAADENAEDEDGEGGGKETSEETSEEK